MPSGHLFQKRLRYKEVGDLSVHTSVTALPLWQGVPQTEAGTVTSSHGYLKPKPIEGPVVTMKRVLVLAGS